jgi:serine/threonine protein phosphatase PrpC
MGYGIQYAELTDQGLKRDENQDSIYSFSNSDMSLFVVADGMGGLEGGKESSETVIRAAKNWVNSFSRDMNPDHQGDIQSLLHAFDSANAEVYSNAVHKQIMSGTTLVCVLITKGMVSCIGIGDSRIYRMRGAYFTQILEDHVWQNMPDIVNAHYSIAELKSNPQYGRLSNYIGMDIQAVFSVYTEKLVSNEIFLLCSDGIYKPCGDNVLMDTIRKAAILPGVLCTHRFLMDILNSLKDFVYSKNAPDNLSAILVKC